MSSRSLLGITALAALAALAGCSEAPPAPAQSEAVDLKVDRLPDDVMQKLEALKASYAQYSSFDAATAAGNFDIQITGCLEMRPQGGMGYHYGNGQLLDGIADETAPEVLLYEPNAHGEMELVGVEFVVPFGLWNGANPPRLFGMDMHANNQFGVWALHAWLYKRNPQGVFADWNPRVNCPPTH